MWYSDDQSLICHSSIHYLFLNISKLSFNLFERFQVSIQYLIIFICMIQMSYLLFYLRLDSDCLNDTQEKIIQNGRGGPSLRIVLGFFYWACPHNELWTQFLSTMFDGDDGKTVDVSRMPNRTTPTTRTAGSKFLFGKNGWKIHWVKKEHLQYS